MNQENTLQKEIVLDHYITTPIYYVNGSPHIGHYYTSLICDGISRFFALNKKNIRFQTGTDEHGQKISQTAQKEGITEIEMCNKYSAKFKQMFIDFSFSASYENFDIENNFFHTSKYLTGIEDKKLFNSGKNFIRTTEGRDDNGNVTEYSIKQGRHIGFVQYVWKTLEKNDWIYKDKYSGWYSVGEEMFVKEDEIIDGKTLTGYPVTWVEQESYFFKLSKLQKVLIKLHKSRLLENQIIKPDNRAYEVLCFLSGMNIEDTMQGKIKEGHLNDLSISRSTDKLKWGIPVPTDENHVMYVWLDALFNYMSALNDFNHNLSSQDVIDQFNNTLQNGDIIHVVGKDILRFHSIYWPAFLIALSTTFNDLDSLDDLKISSLKIPTVVAHGWWKNGEQKISKSLGSIVCPYEETKWIEDTFLIDNNVANDYFRFTLLKLTSLSSDGAFSREMLTNTVNTRLVNNICNLHVRMLSMMTKNFKDGLSIDVSKFEKFDSLEGSLNDLHTLIQESTKNEDKILLNLIEFVENIADKYNKNLEESKPWDKSVSVNEKIEIFSSTFLKIYTIWVCLLPVIPYIASQMLDSLKIHSKYRNFETLIIILSDPSKISEILNIPFSNFEKPAIIAKRMMQI